MSSKCNIRSFRFSDRVAEILDSQDGSSLNAKFENLVLYCFDKVPLAEKELNSIENEIQAKRKVLYNLHNDIKSIETIKRELEYMEHYLNRMSQRNSL